MYFIAPEESKKRKHRKKYYSTLFYSKLRWMKYSYVLPDGSLGTVDFVDDAGQIQMKWDNSSSLALIYGTDVFRIIPNVSVTKYIIKGILENKPVYYKKTSIFGDLNGMFLILLNQLKMLHYMILLKKQRKYALT